MSDLELEPLVDGDATLRVLREADLPETLLWRNDPMSRQWFHSDAVIEWDAHFAWFRSYLARPDDHVFVLEVGGRPVAQVSLYDIERAKGEFGRLLVDPSTRGKGYGSIASRLCLRVADTVLNLKQLHLEVKSDNIPAISIYEALGFEVSRSASTPVGSLYMIRRQSV